jgi:hypothetical protein
MGGTDNIENPGPYLHRSSKKAPHMGILSTPPSFKVPASGVPLPPLPVEDRPMSREETVQAYAARLDALNAMGLSGPGADPPDIELEVEEPLEVTEPALVAADGRDASEEPAQEGAGEDKSASIAFVPSRTGPFQTISVPLYPKGQEENELEARPVKTPRWRGG